MDRFRPGSAFPGRPYFGGLGRFNQTLTLSAGEGSPFRLEFGVDLGSWSEEGSFEGDNEAVTSSSDDKLRQQTQKSRNFFLWIKFFRERKSLANNTSS